jgi:hypothetical protein
LLVNGISFGNWSSVIAQRTDGLGALIGSGNSGGGFRNNILDTGWFYSNSSSLMTNLFASLRTSHQITYQVLDSDPYDNYYDFTQGIDKSLINVGQGPGVVGGGGTGSVPEPTTLTLLGLGLAGLGFMRRRT